MFPNCGDGTHLTSHTAEHSSARINALMSRFTLGWGTVR